MKKNKFYGAMITAVLIISLIFTGCGKGKSNDNADASTKSNSEAPETTESTDVTATFVPVSLVKNEDVSISVSDLNYDETWGYTVEFCLENHTDESVTYSIEDSYVNDLKSTVLWSAEVAAGDKQYEETTFYVDPAEISDAKKMTFDWLVYTTGKNKSDSLVNETTDFYINDNKEYTPYSYTAKDSDQIVLENDNITLYITGIDPEGYGGYTLNVYAENKGNNPVQVSVDKSTVNGVEVEVYGTFGLLPGMKSNSKIYWMENDFDSAGIDNVSAIELNISVMDEETFKEIDSIDYKVVL